MQKDTKAAVLKRLKRVSGQVGGIAGMVENDRYCIDVVTQISAVRAALRRIEEEVLQDRGHCVGRRSRAAIVKTSGGRSPN